MDTPRRRCCRGLPRTVPRRRSESARSRSDAACCDCESARRCGLRSSRRLATRDSPWNRRRPWWGSPPASSTSLRRRSTRRRRRAAALSRASRPRTAAGRRSVGSARAARRPGLDTVTTRTVRRRSSGSSTSPVRPDERPWEAVARPPATAAAWQRAVHRPVCRQPPSHSDPGRTPRHRR